jgi:protein-tyrosine kinase
MSKNFELMQQAEIGLGAQVNQEPQPPPVAFNGATNGNGLGIHLSSEDKLTREESFKLVQSIFLLRGETAPRVVVFAGVDAGNGCSWTCARVAETLAGQKLGKVCLVDGNLRSPSLPAMFGVSNHYGLTDALAKAGSIRDFVKVLRSDNLWLLSCGSLTAGSPNLLNSDGMKLRMAELREEFDYVLIDSPPLNTYADGVAIGQLADGLVLVLEAGSTRREAALKVTESLRAAQISILGAVLNKRTFPIPESVYNWL